MPFQKEDDCTKSAAILWVNQVPFCSSQLWGIFYIETDIILIFLWSDPDFLFLYETDGWISVIQISFSSLFLCKVHLGWNQRILLCIAKLPFSVFLFQNIMHLIYFNTFWRLVLGTKFTEINVTLNSFTEAEGDLFISRFIISF